MIIIIIITIKQCAFLLTIKYNVYILLFAPNVGSAEIESVRFLFAKPVFYNASISC